MAGASVPEEASGVGVGAWVGGSRVGGSRGGSAAVGEGAGRREWSGQGHRAETVARAALLRVWCEDQPHLVVPPPPAPPTKAQGRV